MLKPLTNLYEVKLIFNISAVRVLGQFSGYDCGIHEIVLQLTTEKIPYECGENYFPTVTESKISTNRFQIAMLYNSDLIIKANTFKALLLKPITSNEKNSVKS